MAASLTADVRGSLAWLFSETLALSMVSDQATLEFALALEDGAGAGQANRLWHAERTLAAESHEDLPLSALPQTLFGLPVDVALISVKALLAINLSVGPGPILRVGGAGVGAWAGPWSDDDEAVLELGPGGCLLLCHPGAGWPVVEGTADLLRIDNPGSAAATYRLAVIGTG